MDVLRRRDHEEGHGTHPHTVMPQRTTPLQDATKHILEGRDKTAMLEVKHINPVKGRGIFSTTVFSQGDFVVEYRGVLVDSAEQRRKQNQSECSVFMFDFTWKRRIWSIDGGEEDGSFGRLVNDEHKLPNCRMKLIEQLGNLVVTVEMGITSWVLLGFYHDDVVFSDVSMEMDQTE
uniref:SET domain-containing protein n=1 Tax=Knipowitschia caucasica TaxID=637954 RepID=A0AAV2LKM4_KNICA